MANRSVELQIKLQNAKSISDLEAVLKEVNSDLKEIDHSSDAFKSLSDVAKKADGDLKSVKDELKGISDEKQLSATFKMGEALAGAFSIATVAASAFGAETEKEIQLAIQKATALTAILQGLKPIGEALSAGNRKAFGEMIKGFKESALGASLFGNSTRAALTATGIGLFIVALGTIVAYWDDISKAIGLASGESERFFEQQHKNLDTSKNLLDNYNKSLDVQNQLLQIQGDKENEIFANKRKALLLEIQLAEQNKKLAEDRIAAYLTENNITAENLKLRQQSAKLFGQSDPFTERLKELQAEFDKAAKAYIDLKNSLTIVDAEQAKFGQDQAKKASEERKKLNDKEIDERAKKLHEAYLKEQEELKSQLDTLNELKAKDGSDDEFKKQHEKELEALSEKHRKEFELEKLQSDTLVSFKDQKSTEQLDKERAQFQERIAQVNTYTQVSLDAFNKISEAFTSGLQRQIDNFHTELDILNTRFQESVANREALEAQLSDAQGTRRDQLLQGIEAERLKEKQLAEERKKIQNAIIKAQNKANDIAWKNSLINSIINTALGITNALGSAPPPANFILAAIVGALGTIEQGVILSNKPEPIPSLATGGFTKGIGFTDSSGYQVAGVVHENEYVVPERVLLSSEGSQLVSALEAMRKGMPSYASGGFSSDALPFVSPDSSNINSLTAESLKTAIESARIFVAATEVRDTIVNIEVIETRAAA